MRVVIKFVLPIVALAVFSLLAFCGNADLRQGLDVVKVLQRTAKGEPIRLVALGGSITLGGEGWIREWLGKTFPQSTVYIQNAGLGGTGSDLGVFRLDRDVISYEPNLVFIEFSVNDMEMADEEAIRNLESIVVRLRKLPEPPGIVLLIAAEQNNGLAKERIHRLATHYKLLEIDLDEALRRHLDETKLTWTDFMDDAVHPNARGHAFYGEVIASRLAPLLDGDASKSFTASLPPPLSEKPLLLEASMMPLTSAPGWQSEDTLPGRAFRSFPGLISASEPGSSISVPFQGTRVGLFFPVAPGLGGFYVSVDGQAPRQILENTYEGYGFQILADDLAPGQHVLNVILPGSDSDTKAINTSGSVKLGAVLVAGPSKSNATEPAAPSGPYSMEVLRKLRFTEIPPDVVCWTGPFSDGKARKRSDLREIYPVEEAALRGDFLPKDTELPGTDLRWSALAEENGPVVDLTILAPNSQSSVFYFATRVIAPLAGPGLLRYSIKGRRQIWVNGEPVLGVKGNTDSDTLEVEPIELKAGVNTILWKIGSTSAGGSFSASVAMPFGGEVEFKNPLSL